MQDIQLKENNIILPVVSDADNIQDSSVKSISQKFKVS